MNSFFYSQFNYCPLAWMFHSCSVNNKINRLHERVLCIVYDDFKSSLQNLLEKDGTVSIHVKNLQKLSTEMFKISKNFSVPLMSELFYQKANHYDLWNPYEFSIPNVNSVFHGQASMRYLGPFIWQLVPSEFKHLNTVSAFKAVIRKWKSNYCACRLCKTIWITFLELTIDAGWSASFVCLVSWWKETISYSKALKPFSNVLHKRIVLEIHLFLKSI